ncbi:hypothetical protein AXF42_Ash000180 [Apostasia shenzhenica]|uniref:Calcineurin-binding protein cabin-1 n=1 Tax=Apostasia shenzhenica TaxID=1088818 RepID=A0A2I0AFM9_9ASPA|nr:hypothetical protein AXF42_Ash000180 [Apostasia shenzhenica]
MFSIAAINDSDSSGQREPLAPTKEAQEFHLSQTYHEGLLKLQAKDYAKAHELFQAVLKDPLLSCSKVSKNSGDTHLLQLRFFTLKNLASVYLHQGSEHYNSALKCYLQAVEIDSKDSVVWNQLGTLSCTMGLLSMSRWAFEQGLLCSPNNWNCMEKLLEILIAIGDEVACLSAADLILRHWPSHYRALHVKKIIEDAEPIPFAPRGIDKLQPKHFRLTFPEKRKLTNEYFAGNASSKRIKQTIELKLSQARWVIMADAVLHLLLPTSGKLSESKALQQESGVNDITRVDECGSQSFTDIRIDICLPTNSELTMDSSGQEICPSGTNIIFSSAFDETKMSKEKEICADKEHQQERRSMRLERLRSRKLGKEDLEFSSGKDPSKFLFETLEPFIMNKEGKNSADCSAHSSMDNLAYSLVGEHDDVARFISKASNNYGAHHLAHMLLEEVSKTNISYDDSFSKILDLEKLTRRWGQDRTPLCCLFLAELCFDQGSMSTDQSKRLEFFSEASYHICKVVELVAMDSPDVLAGLCDHPSSSKTSFYLEDSDILINSVNGSFKSKNVKLFNGLCQESSEDHSPLTDNTAFCVRFFWLSGCLSLLSSNKEKALKEFFICLSILKNGNVIPDVVPLPHCRLVRSLNVDRVVHKINLLSVDELLQKINVEFMEKGLYEKCVEMLSPLLFSSKDVYLDMVSANPKESDSVISLELRAIDALISACEKTQPINIEVYLNSHRLKLQLIAVATGMLDSPAQQNDRVLFPKANSVFDLDSSESSIKQWLYMVAEEVKDISQVAARLKNIMDQNAAHGCINSLDNVIGDFQRVLLQVMCYSVRKILTHKVSIPGSSSHMDQLESCLLVDAATALCKLQHLHPSMPVKAQVDLIVAVHDLLAEYGLCCAGRDSDGKEGTFLKFAIKHLLALDMKLRSLYGANAKDEMLQRDIQEGMNVECGVPIEEKAKDEGVMKGKLSIDLNSDSTEKQDGTFENAEASVQAMEGETEKVDPGIENALDQSFFCLYGLNINPDSSSEEDLAIHKNTSRGDYQTKEQCADVFQYILPYSRALSRTGLVKLRRVFRAIRKHFTQPPNELLVENSIDRFLDNPQLCENKLYELCGTDGKQEAIMNLLFMNGRGPEALKTSPVVGCSSESYMEVYKNLYYFMSQAEDTNATDKYPGFVLKMEGEEFVEQNANLLKYDLLYNPLRFESWQKLANIYDEEVDLLLNDGSKHVNIMNWRKSSTVPQRVEIGRRRSRRCLLMSLALSRTLDQQSQIHELLALVYYDNIQNVVPFYDQRLVVPKRDEIWTTFCQNSKKHFEKAFSLKPDWLHAFYLGKLCEKLGYSYKHAFSYYSKAITLNPSAVDPVYRMHASRLKLLYTHGKRNLNVLQIVAAYSFSQQAKDQIMNIFSWSSQDLMNFEEKKDAASENSEFEVNNESLLDEAWHVLYDDCLYALQICVEGELKHFHKARYRLACGFYRRGGSGDLERAKEELSFCFKSSRSAFTINMWEIDGMTKKGRRKYLSHGGNRRNLEVSLSESSRKFITCIRKYILFYLNLLGRTGDLSTLERAYVYLRTDKKFYLCLCDIVPIAIGKNIQVLASSIQNAGALGSTDSSSLEQFLDRLLNLLIDHVSILADLSALPDINDPQMSEANLCGYIHRYIDLLESDIRLDALEAVNEKIRKRFKNPKLSSSNFAGICKHASLAWCRALLMKLALVTPLPDSGNPADQGCQAGALETDLLLFVDLQPDDFFSTTMLEGSAHSKGLDLNWYQTLSKIKDVCIKQAFEENLEALAALMRCAFSFYRESSSAALPSGINLYTVSSSQLAGDGYLPPDKEKVEYLELSIPRKLLLWAYTLFHGRYTNISAVVKFCEENAKSRLKRGAAVPQILPQGNALSGLAHSAEIEENQSVSMNSSLLQEDSARTSTMLPSPKEAPKSSVVALPVSQLNRCSGSKGTECP